MATLVSLALLCLVLGAGPALAQKDPFAPVIDTSTTTTTTTTIGSVDDGSPTVLPVVGNEGLANTGAGISGWLAIAYSLIVLGGGSVVIAKMYQPQPIRRR
jgi:serine acetyltransferase